MTVVCGRGGQNTKADYHHFLECLGAVGARGGHNTKKKLMPPRHQVRGKGCLREEARMCGALEEILDITAKMYHFR